MRTESNLTIDELAYRLALPRTTIFYWVRDLPIPTTADQTLAARRAGRVSHLKHLKLRQEAYDMGAAEFDRLAKDRTSETSSACMSAREANETEMLSPSATRMLR